MEECSVLIESTLPAEDKTSRWFNLPIDYELFRDLLGVEADSSTSGGADLPALNAVPHRYQRLLQ